MAGKTLAYVRVSTVDQNTERQSFDGIHLDKTFTDKASGRDADRPALAQLMDYARDGDTVVVHSLDRLARNLDDLRRIVRELTGRGVTVRFVQEGLTFTGDANPMSQLLLSVMGAFAEFERSLIRERQREGIAIAKAKGMYKGRKPALSAAQEAEAVRRAAAGEPKGKLAADLGISRETLRQVLMRAGSPAGSACASPGGFSASGGVTGTA